MPRVNGWSDDEFERRASNLAALIRRVWRTISRSVYASLTAKPFITSADTSSIPAEWSEQLDTVVLGYVESTYLDAAGHVADTLGLPEDQLIGDDLVVAHLAEVRNRLRGIGDDVWQLTREQITAGTQAGESIAQIAARVRNVTGVSEGRANVIARTEVHAAHEAGTYAQALYVDPEGEKEWLATNDSRTRATHLAADGQKVKIGETFDVGGSALRYPGDPRGAADETINCRCTSVYDFDIISSVSDEEMSDDLAVTAASWDPAEHPRGKDGKFIKKGTGIFQALTAKNDVDFVNGVLAINASEWDTLTSAQKSSISKKINDVSNKPGFQYTGNAAATKISQMMKADAALTSTGPSKKPATSAFGVPTVNSVVAAQGPPGSPVAATTKVIWSDNKHNSVVLESTDGNRRVVWDDNTKKYLLQEATGDPKTWQTQQSWTKKDAYANLKGQSGWVVPNVDKHQDLAGVAPTPSVTTTPTVTAPTPAVTPSVPIGLKGLPGSTAKITTSLIWGKHPTGTTILESADGNTRVRWSGDKYIRETKNPDGSWSVTASWTKKDAYAQLKGDTSWVIPGGAPTAGTPVTTTPPGVVAPGVDVTTPVIPSAPGVPTTVTPTTVAAPTIPTLSDDQKKFLSEEAQWGTISQNESIALTLNLTDEEFNGLSDTQKKFIEQKLDLAGEGGVAGSADASAKWNTLKTNNPPTPTVTPAPPLLTTPTAAPATGTILPNQVNIDDVAKQWANGDFSDNETLFESADGTILVVAVNDNIVTKLKTPDGTLVPLNVYTGDDPIGDFKNDTSPNIKWVKPGTSTTPAAVSTTHPLGSPTGVTSPVASPPSAPSVSAPTTPATPSPAGITFESFVPWYAKEDFKQVLKLKKLGYWSKPEAIWDALKTIQAKYPHATEPGYSKYSPLAIFQALDSMTNISKSKTPFQDKMVKWASTAKGVSYISKSGVMTQGFDTPTSGSAPSVSAPSVPTPSVPPISSIPTPSPTSAFNVGSGDISHLSDADKATIFKKFKGLPGTYLSSDEKSIFNALKKTAESSSLDLLQVIKTVDEMGAKSAGVTNGHLFEKKITDWLATPTGTAVALGKKPALPASPGYAPGIDPNVNLPSFEESSKFTYDVLPTANAVAWMQPNLDKYGEVSSTQVSALTAYTGGVYDSINGYYYGAYPTISTTNESIAKRAQKGMRPSSQPVLLHRGVYYNGIADATEHDDLVKAVGTTWKSGGFFSTSVGGTAAFSGKPVIIEIEAPPGTPMAYLKPISKFSGENEMLLAAGLHYKILDVKKVDGKSVVRVRVVPDPEVVTA